MLRLFLMIAFATCATRGAPIQNDIPDATTSATKSWEEVAPMAEERDGLTVTVLDGKLYAVGGYNNDGGDNRLSSVERYDPALDAWEAVVPMAAARRKAFAGKM